MMLRRRITADDVVKKNTVAWSTGRMPRFSTRVILPLAEDAPKAQLGRLVLAWNA
jgi:hypothetical protein